MARDPFEIAFARLKADYRTRKAKSFLDDLRAEIDESDKLAELFGRKKPTEPYVSVTFDRRTNDASFSYADFDKLLLVIDAKSGGVGIFKPVNQLRALRWNGTHPDLVKLLGHFGRTFPSLNFYSLLVLPFPKTISGVRVLKKLYKK